MPKAKKEDAIKIKLQARALFEIGKYTLEEICETIKKNGGSLTRQTLAKWITENPNDIWKINGLIDNKVYDTAKIEQKAKILDSVVKKKLKTKKNITVNIAQQEANKEVKKIFDLELERNKLMQELIEFKREALDCFRIASKYAMAKLQKGSNRKVIQEDIVGLNGKITGEKKTISTVEDHKPSEYAKVCDIYLKGLYGLGLVDVKPPKSFNFDNGKMNDNQGDLKNINEEEGVIIQKIEEDNKNDNFANLCRVISH